MSADLLTVYRSHSYSISSILQDKAIELVERGDCLAGRAVGILKPIPLIADVTVQIILSLGHLLGSLLINPFLWAVSRINGTDPHLYFSFTRALNCGKQAGVYAIDTFTSPFINGADPTLYNTSFRFLKQPVVPSIVLSAHSHETEQEEILAPRIVREPRVNPEIERLREQLAAAEAQLQQQTPQTTTPSEPSVEVEGLRQTIQRLEAERTALETQVATSQREQADTESRLTPEIQRLQTALAAAQEQLQQQTPQTTTPSEPSVEVEGLRQTIQRLENEKGALETQVDTSQRERADTEARLTPEIQRLQTELAAAQEQLQQQTQQAAQELSAAQQTHAAEMERLIQSIQRLESASLDLQSQQASTESRLTPEIQSLQEQLAAAQQELNQTRAQIQQSHSGPSTISTDQTIMELQAENAKLQHALNGEKNASQLGDELTKGVLNLHELDAEIRIQQMQESHDRFSSEKQEEIDRLTETLEERNREVENLRGQLSAPQGNPESTPAVEVSHQLVPASSSLISASTEKDLRDANQEIARLKGIIEADEGIIRNYEEQLHDLLSKAESTSLGDLQQVEDDTSNHESVNLDVILQKIDEVLQEQQDSELERVQQLYAEFIQRRNDLNLNENSAVKSYLVDFMREFVEEFAKDEEDVIKAFIETI